MRWKAVAAAAAARVERVFRERERLRESSASTFFCLSLYTDGKKAIPRYTWRCFTLIIDTELCYSYPRSPSPHLLSGALLHEEKCVPFPPLLYNYIYRIRQNTNPNTHLIWAASIYSCRISCICSAREDYNHGQEITWAFLVAAYNCLGFS